MRLVYGLAFAFSLYAATGCSAAWPTVNGVGDAHFLATGGVRTVAILAPDVAIGTALDKEEPPDQIANRFELTAGNAMEGTLVQRGYEIVDDAEPDALFVLNGSAFSGDNGPSGGEVALIVIGVVLIVGLIALAAATKDHGHHGGGGGFHGIAKAPHIGHTVGAWHQGGAAYRYHAWHAARLATDISLAFALPPGPPVQAFPPSGASHAVLGLQLIERATGRILWQAQSEFPADPARPDDVRKAVAALAASLPPARVPTAAAE